MKFKKGRYLIIVEYYTRGPGYNEEPAAPVIKKFATLKSLLCYIRPYSPTELKEDFHNSAEEYLKDIIDTNGDGDDYIAVYFITPKDKLIQFI